MLGRFLRKPKFLEPPPELNRKRTSARASVLVCEGSRLGADFLPNEGGNEALVVDATGIEEPARLVEIYEFLHERLPRLASSGRVVIIGLVGNEALTGLTRSIGREIGKKGATANCLLVPDRKDAAKRVAGPLKFLLSGRGAYVDGQVLTLGTGSAHPVGRRALVTGAARGIGEAIAKMLAKDGFMVVGLDHPSSGEALEKAMAGIGGEALTCDLGDAKAIAKLEVGDVDVLVNNAGITRDKTLAKMSRDQWQSVIDVNLIAPRLLTDRVAPKSRVIFVSSIVGIAGNRGQTNYATAKAGLIGLAREYAEKWHGEGVTANAVAPGFIDTAMTAQMPFINREVAKRLCSLGRMGLPEDVAAGVAFLASAESYALSGQTLRVCGQSILGA